MTATGLEPRTTYLVNKHSTIWPSWPNDWALFWVLISTVHLTVCSCHVTYVFQSESTIYSCLNVNEIFARIRREIWNLNDCNWTRTQNHLVRKRILDHLAKLVKWLSCVLCAYLNGAFDCLFVCSCHVTYAFQSASTLYSCLNVKELLTRSRLEIWSLSDCNWTRTQNHLVPWHSGDYKAWIHSETSDL